jgi:phosphopentomutase
LRTFDRICMIVLDSVGIGELPDARDFGDSGAHTLGHIAERVPSLALPNLRSLGLGNIADVPGLPPVEKPTGCYGKMAETSVGKDTMTGHWELMGLNVTIPFQTFPNGFPHKLIETFEHETGRRVIGNKAASGTDILEELGDEQMKTGAWIVYTSADSVFQLAAHEEVIPLEELYDACRTARRLTQGEFAVGRVIARPYIGNPGAFQRTTNRHDYAVKPPSPTVLNLLKNAGKDVIAVGKIGDIFSMEGITESIPTKSNANGVDQTIEAMQRGFNGFCFTNLVDFDSLYGHRRDPEGYARALEEFDRSLPALMETFTERDLLMITADHGNDPVHAGTDHTREYVPLLAWSPGLQGGLSLGVRSTFADAGATVLANFGLEPMEHGTSFLKELK